MSTTPLTDTKSSNVDLEALCSVSSTTTYRTMSIPISDKQSQKQSILSKIASKIDSKVIYDAILGLSDGLTVPFALTAGLASIGTTRIVILGGLAELVAGAISMGLGGFIGAQSEHEAYQATERKCTTLIHESPHQVRSILQDHFDQYDLPSASKTNLINSLLTSPSPATLTSQSPLHNFLLQHHFSVEKPSLARPYISALTLALSYFLGGFLALIPYFCVQNDQVYRALRWSIGVMAVVMLAFGYVKTCVVRGWSGRENVLAGARGAAQMLVVGALAVGAAVGLVRGVEYAGRYGYGDER